MESNNANHLRSIRTMLILILTIFTTISSTFLSYADINETSVGVGPNVVVGLGPGETSTDETYEQSPEDLGYAYVGIPLTADDIELMCRMAYGETMYHDGTCPANTVKACYEVVFNRYLHDANAPSGSGLFHRGELTISRLLTKSQFEGICSKSRWNNLSEEKKNEYRILVWQVHNQGPTVLDTSYLYWQSSAGTRGKNNRIWVGFIYDENGNKVEGTTTDKSKIVKHHGNWYRQTYK